jgi:hypothetical protein
MARSLPLTRIAESLADKALTPPSMLLFPAEKMSKNQDMKFDHLAFFRNNEYRKKIHSFRERQLTLASEE